MKLSSVSSRNLVCALAIFCMAAPVLLTGCGGGNSAKTVDVEGTVTLDGKPLANADVEFQPADNGSPSYGKTDASGKYELMFTADQSGAIVGEHQVRITTEGESEDDDGNSTATKEVVPAKYNAETELKATVEKGGGPYDFILTTE